MVQASLRVWLAVCCLLAATTTAVQAADEHNPYNLGVANASPQMEAPEEFKTDLAIYTFIVFVLLLLLLWKFAWGPISAGLAKRENTITAQIEDAKKNQLESQRMLRDYEAKLAAATDEVREMLATARRDADAAKERIIAEAQEAAQRERQRTLAEIDTAKSAALSEVAERGAELAVQLAGRIVHRELKPEDHARLIRESLDKLPSKN